MSRTTATDNIAQLFGPVAAPGVSPEDVRIAEAMVFASAEPLEESTIAAQLSEGADVAAVMDELRRLTMPALETLAVIAYKQPITRGEIEEIRGVAVSKGALDVLMEVGWVRMRGRRKAPGRPITYGTTTEFLVQFGLDAVADLPGLDELKGAGLFDGKLPVGYDVPHPNDAPALRADEDPLEDSSALERAWAPVTAEESR